MLNIFEYTDYRKYLRDFYETKKAKDPKFSHRSIARQVGFNSSGFFAQIVQGKSNISLDITAKFCDFLRLKKPEADYFQLLVLYNQSKAEHDRRKYLEKLLRFGKGRISLVEADRYEYFSKWYYVAVRSILDCWPFRGSYSELAKLVNPPISAAEAEQAVATLRRLGFIKKMADGAYRASEPLLSTGGQARFVEGHALAINRFLSDTMDLGKKALAEIPHAGRSISSLTMSLSEESYREMEAKVDAFRKEMLELASSSRDEDRVIQFNIQIFPVSRVPLGKGQRA